MISMAVFCDFCEQRIRTDDDGITYTNRTKEIDTRKLYPHLCERCATKIDEAVRFDRKNRKTKSEIAERFAKINAERRERLGMKG